MPDNVITLDQLLETGRNNNSSRRGQARPLKTDSKTSNKPSLAPHLRQWVATCLLHGYSPDSIATKLAGYLDAPESAVAEVENIRADPIFAAAAALRQRRDKLASLLDVFARLLRQSPVAEGVPIEVGLPPGRFREL